MIYIGDHLAFWIFTTTEIGFLAFAIIVARFGAARDYKILGITRYFGYAVVFFALDAFAWVILTAAMSINFNLTTISIVSVYVAVVLVGIGYFLTELKKLVR
jgi:hypothetical protein